jgi:nitronate monooxygenase
MVVTYWGAPQRRTSRLWLHQCGSVDEARAAHVAGADGVIVQGVEAGGHVRGKLPALELLGQVRGALPPELPLLLAGGLADVGDVRTALEAGAAAAVLGSRFLLSEESRAHPGYKRAVCAAGETVLTELFGIGWPAPHRVVPNAATRRWLAKDPRGPAWARAVQRSVTPAARVLPDRLAARLAAAQRPELPLLSPSPPLDDAPLGRLLEAGPLYAGESVARIGDVGSAAALVGELTP